MNGRMVGLASLVGMLTALWAVFVYAPTEATMGIVQRIFYFHVSAALMGFFAFFVVFVASIAFLLKRDLEWDRVARCSAEIGVLFASINLVTGMLWAKPIWGDWWVWDARLTLQLLLWILFISYIMLGTYIAEPMKRAALQAVFGILAFIVIGLSTSAWQTKHDFTGMGPHLFCALRVLMGFDPLHPARNPIRERSPR